jgi:hypothetical protein
VTWDYLPSLDDRLRFIAGYLLGKTAGATIVDLDCHEARLLRYIEPDYREYLGNDIEDRFPGQFPRTRFVIATDIAFAETVPACDILLALGWTPGRNRRESSTLDAAIARIIARHSPRIVVIEAVQEYIDAAPALDGYVLSVSADLDLGLEWTHKRAVRCHEAATMEVPA